MFLTAASWVLQIAPLNQWKEGFLISNKNYIWREDHFETIESLLLWIWNTINLVKMSRPHKFQTTMSSGPAIFLPKIWVVPFWGYPFHWKGLSLADGFPGIIPKKNSPTFPDFHDGSCGGNVGFMMWVVDKNYLLLAKDMAKVDGPLSVVKVFTQIWTSQVHFLLLLSSADVFGYSCVFRSRPTRYSSSQFQWTKWIYNTILYTIWLFNSLPWKITLLLMGKPSISMDHLYHGELLYNI